MVHVKVLSCLSDEDLGDDSTIPSGEGFIIRLTDGLGGNITAFFTGKSPVENLKMSRAYPQRTAFPCKVLELLSFITDRSVTPEDESRPRFHGRIIPCA